MVTDEGDYEEKGGWALKDFFGMRAERAGVCVVVAILVCVFLGGWSCLPVFVCRSPGDMWDLPSSSSQYA
jgi:hypothetical protein